MPRVRGGLLLLGGLTIIPLIPQGFIPTLDRGEFNVVFQSAPPKIAGAFNPQAVAPQETETPDQGSAFNFFSDMVESPEAVLLRRGRRIAEKLEPTLTTDPTVANTFTLVRHQGQSPSNHSKIPH